MALGGSRLQAVFLLYVTSEAFACALRQICRGRSPRLRSLKHSGEFPFDALNAKRFTSSCEPASPACSKASLKYLNREQQSLALSPLSHRGRKVRVFDLAFARGRAFLSALLGHFIAYDWELTISLLY